MKIVFRVIYICFFLIFGAVFFLQTPMAKNRIKRAFTTLAAERGVDLHIEKLEGNLPFDWTLKGVEWKVEEESFFLEEIRLRVAVLPLFKKQIECTYIKGEGGSYRGVPFYLSAKGRVDFEGKKPIKVSHFLIEGDEFFIRLDGKFYPDFTILDGNIAFQFPDLSIFGGQGTVMGMGQITKETAQIDCYAQDLLVQGQSIAKTTLTVNGTRTQNVWEGEAKFVGGTLEIPMEGTAAFSFNPGCRLFSIEELRAEGPNLNLFGRVDFDPTLKCLEGTIFARSDDLSSMRSLLPGSYLKGRIGAKIDFQSYATIQDLKCQIEVEEFSAYESSFDALTVETTLYDLFGDLRGEFSVEGTTVSLPQLELSHVLVKSTFEPNASPFEFSAKGTWKDPLEIVGRGNWQKRSRGIFLHMNRLNGYAFNKPFSLCEPFSVDWNRDHFKLSNVSLDIAMGHLDSKIDLTSTTSLIKLKAEDFPLDFIALPHKHYSLEGLASIDVDLQSRGDHLEGICNVALKRALFKSEGADDAFTTKGSLQAHINGSSAQVHGELKALDEQYLHFFATLPLRFQQFPFHLEIDEEKPIAGELTGEGKLEDLFNFINIGSHRLEGWLSSHLFISNTLKNPTLQGQLELQGGLYENYATGTFLQNISAKAEAHRQTITITDLYANDRDNGSVTARGKILLSPEQNFPYSVAADLDDLHTVSFDTIAGEFNGHITISGNRSGATAIGDLEVVRATFRIPDELPSVLPELPITFVNPPESISRKKLPSPSVSPLLLDLNIDVPRKAYVEGRGIHAELKGKLHITGTYTDIVAKGALQLVTGEYLFSGKVFNLSQGELIFQDRPTPSAYISLTGTCDLPEVDVTVMLRGPLTSPKLSFQSSPPLPTSSLLAQILFNKDISEISAVQAIQLAQTVISLSGNSAPDILERIRKTLGVDRLTIVTSENDPGKISLQIGKYLMRGVMLTLTQGAESRNVTVEVDLKKGIMFQAEVNEDQQGKFSLKSHHHY